MARQQRVVWHEGMNLDPHHFQQADRYHQAALNFRARALQRYDWGFLELKIDADALAQGQLALEKCKGLTDDGLMFDMAGGDRLPKPRAIAPAFAPTVTKLDVYLAIRAERPNGFNCRIDDEARDAAENRFTMERRELPDDNTGTNLRAIGVARPNFVLRFAEELLDEFSVLKIAEVERNATGFKVSDTFIPPCVSIAAADNLMRLGNDLLGQLVRLSNQQRGALPFGKKDVTVADLTGLWLAQTINPFIALLKHRLETSRCHPEILYTDLLTLAGQLTTNPSPLGILPAGFPAYEHNNLARCFPALCRLIHELLKVEVQRPYIEIGLKHSENQPLWFSESIDDGVLQNYQFYLAAGGNVEQDKITRELMQKFKIATPEGIHALAAATANGLRAVYSPRIPPGLPDNLHYFQLEKTGFFWEAIVQSRGLAIFVPAEFMKLELKLLAVKQA